MAQLSQISSTLVTLAHVNVGDKSIHSFIHSCIDRFLLQTHWNRRHGFVLSAGSTIVKMLTLMKLITPL